MDSIGKIIAGVLENPLVASALIIVISYIIYKGLSNILLGKNRKIKFSIGSRGQTYLRLAQSAFRYIFVIVTTLMVLQVNHVNVSSVLAGVGIIGGVLGIASQDALKDIIRGLTLISDDYFSVGDVINYNGTEGRVIVIGLKTTKIQDINTENILSIANREIDEAQVVAPCIYVNIPLPYDLTTKKAAELSNEISAEAVKSDLITDCVAQGVNHLNDSSVDYQFRASCDPAQKLAATRALKQVAYAVLEKHHIPFPYPQLDIHKKA